MKAIILSIVLFATALVSAQTQFEQGMGKALKMWGEGKPTEATALLERIALVEKENWLPNYYIALINTTSAFQTKDKEAISALLNKAQSVLDIETAKNDKNPELLILQAMINTAWIVYDPMTNGMKLSAPTMELYDKALQLDAKNPRAVFCKAEFEIGAAQFWGTDTTPMCEQVKKSIELFNQEKPATPFAPDWGKDRAEQILLNCGKK